VRNTSRAHSLAHLLACARPPRITAAQLLLATNTAESSITVSDVDIVVDTLLEKQVTFDPVTRQSSLDEARTAAAGWGGGGPVALGLLNMAGVCCPPFSPTMARERMSWCAYTPPSPSLPFSPFTYWLAHW